MVPNWSWITGNQRLPGRALLPWYNFAATRESLDSLWVHIRTFLERAGQVDLPLNLNHDLSSSMCANDPDLILSQCCGLDLFRAHASAAVPLAAPVMSCLDVAPGMYFSHIVGSPTSSLDYPVRVVVNDVNSHSGNTALQVWLRQRDIELASIVVSGAHLHSVQMLHSGDADIAAIDALSWRFLDQTDLIILGQSEPAPAPPFIVGAAANIPRELMVEAVDAALQQQSLALGISGAKPIRKSDYCSLFQLARDNVLPNLSP